MALLVARAEAQCSFVCLFSKAEAEAGVSYKVSLEEMQENREEEEVDSAEEPTGPPFGIVLNGHSLVSTGDVPLPFSFSSILHVHCAVAHSLPLFKYHMHCTAACSFASI